MAESICTALYYRCSTDEQVESIPGQKMLLHRYAGEAGVDELLALYVGD